MFIFTDDVSKRFASLHFHDVKITPMDPPNTPESAAGLPVCVPAMPVGRRDEFLDALRGFAIGGIFMVNISGFKSPVLATAALGNPLHDGWSNVFTSGLILTLCMSKFIALFAMLFGLGMAMQYQRSVAEGRPFGGFFVRRSLWLLLFGVLHATFFWAGDVLAVYAIFGLMGLAMIGWSPKALLVTAASLFTVFVLASGLMAFMQDVGGSNDEFDQWLAGMGEWWLKTYQHGSFGEITLARLAEWGMMNLFGLFSHLIYAFTLFVFGTYLGKGDVITRLSGNLRGMRVFVACALPAGILMSAWYPLQLYGGEPASGISMAGAYAGLWIGGLLVGLSYASVLFLVHARGGCRWLMVRLAAAGRMALTNYLLQSIIASLLFMNYGLGWYGQVTAPQGVLIVALVFSLQLLLSPVWLRFFHFGPFEWIWRALAYGKRPPFLRERTEVR